MSDYLHISDVRINCGTLSDQYAGLLGFLEFTLDGAVRVEGIELRRGRDGRLFLTFPPRRDRSGDPRFYVHPVDAGARCTLERAIFAAIGLDTESGDS